jgi:GAF domain-containing protein
VSQAEIDRERQLTAAFVELADTLVDDYDVIDVLDRLIAHSVTLLAAEAAGIMLVGPQRGLRVVASSTDESGLTELMQIQADEGPRVDCVRTGAVVAVTDLENAAERWPRLTAALAGNGGYRSVHALPLRLRGEAIGGMNLFHTRPGPLPPADLRLGQALADIATIGILQERAIRRGEVVAEQLKTALNSRVVIEQAKASSRSTATSPCTRHSTGSAATPAAATSCSATSPEPSSPTAASPSRSLLLPPVTRLVVSDSTRFVMLGQDQATG